MWPGSLGWWPFWGRGPPHRFGTRSRVFFFTYHSHSCTSPGGSEIVGDPGAAAGAAVAIAGGGGGAAAAAAAAATLPS